MARPPSNKIDKVELENIIKLCPTEKETADWFDVSIDTLYRYLKKNYNECFAEFRDKRFSRTRMAIKKKQIEKAMTGDNTMLIWVGKQYLGQSEKIEQRTQLNVEDESKNKKEDILARLDEIVNDRAAHIKSSFKDNLSK
jgi:predicted site-specific integrase-resolvase